MSSSVTLQQLIERGVALQAHEAVALAQRLIETCTTAVDLTPPLGPPTLESVRLDADGSVTCRGCAVTPAVSEIGLLLESMLPRATTRAPGGLRYTIARSLLEVDAPPFDSLAELSATLIRYERGDRTTVLRDLYSRFMAASGRAVIAPFPDRRKTQTPPDELRRRLREADRELYERAGVTQPVAAVPESKPASPAPQANAPAAASHSSTPQSSTAESIAPDPVDLPLTWPTATEDPPLLFATPSTRRRRGWPARWMVATAAAALLSFVGGRALVTWQRQSETRTAPLTASGGTSRPNGPAAPPQVLSRSSGPANSTTSRNDRNTRRAETADRVPPLPAANPAAPAVTLARALDRSGGPTFSPSFASNGTLFFHTGRTADARSDIRSADMTGDLRVMSIAEDGARNFHVQPSPDDTRVAFDSDRDGERGVYIANRDGSDVRRVSGAGYAAVPTWSPDGERLAFVRAEVDRPHVWNLWLLVLSTGEMRRLTTFPYGQTWGASWFRDGRRIAYTHEDRLVLLDVEDGTMRRYTSPVARRLVRTPAVSPDGRYVIFQVDNSGAWLLDLNDGSMRCVLADPTAEEFAWSPDGRRVAFHSRRDGQWGIWLMSSS